ncbi:MAG: hypothetical protein ACTSO7_10375 [Candidatus Heimdallarchaeota archaeon]
MSEKKKTTKKQAKTAKKTTATKSKATTKKTTTTKPKTTTTKKSTATKKPATVKKPKKAKFVKAQIIGYRRNNRLQTTNQAVAKIIEEYNHKALVGKRFVLNFSESDAVATGIVTAVHGQPRNKQLRLRFEKAGMTSHAINQIIEIQI